MDRGKCHIHIRMSVKNTYFFPAQHNAGETISVTDADASVVVLVLIFLHRK